MCKNGYYHFLTKLGDTKIFVPNVELPIGVRSHFPAQVFFFSPNPISNCNFAKIPSPVAVFHWQNPSLSASNPISQCKNWRIPIPILPLQDLLCVIKHTSNYHHANWKYLLRVSVRRNVSKTHTRKTAKCEVQCCDIPSAQAGSCGGITTIRL